MPLGKPTNKILVAGEPIVEECLAENTGASDDLKPGMLCIKGTEDHQVKYAGDAAVNVDGVVDYDPRYDITEALAEGTSVRKLSGSIVVVLTLAESQTINKGDKLIAAALGQCQAYPASPAAGDEEKIIGKAEESVTTGAGETKPIMVELK